MALRFAIVGSGPAGFFFLKSLTKQIPNCKVDMFEKLPVPFGLIRYGVAPDHAEIKNIISEFTSLAQNSNFRYFGNINVGSDINSSDLSKTYSAVIYANGSASADKTLSIPGGEYSRSARKLVEFYNSMPGCEDFSFKTTEKLGIIGNGNVAIDIARVLASPISRLSPTDISSNALFSLSESSLKEINIYGRRGAIQSAMSVKELRYLHKISGISLRAFQDEIQNSLNLASVQEGKINLTQTTQQERARKRLFELINSLPREHDPQARVKVNLRFLLAPERFSDNKKLLLNVTSLQGKEYEQQAANTGKYIEEDCDMLIRSIGYSSLPIDKDLPFNEKEGVIRNVGGRVQDNVYVAGWARTGPFGVIDTTMRNVFQTFDALVADIADGKIIGNNKEILDLANGKKFVTFNQWLKIDAFEVEAGKAKGKSREKLRTVEEMLEIAFA